jgi:hypothetical protein
MISHARYSMTLRAALAAAAAANKSYGSAGMTSDLAAGFDLWSRDTSPVVTQREWINFYSDIYRTGARAYWLIAKRAGKDAVAPECCTVLAPGLVEIAKVIPSQLGQAPIALPLDRAIADAVRFDADGDGVESSELLQTASNSSSSSSSLSTGSINRSSSSSSSGNSNSNGNKEIIVVIEKYAAGLTNVDILEYGIMRLGTLCNALRPVQSLGH